MSLTLKGHRCGHVNCNWVRSEVTRLLRGDALEHSVDDPLHHVLLVDSSLGLIHVQLIILHKNNKTVHVLSAVCRRVC